MAGVGKRPGWAVRNSIREYTALVFIILLIIPASGFAQLTKIMGKVTDAETKEPIPFVNIIIMGTTLGTLTDFEGRYSLDIKTTADSIRVSLLGYAAQTKKFQKGQFQEINFDLAWQNENLPEVTIHYTGNPAEVILNKIIANKKKNSLKSFENYQYEAYTKIEVDANNISDKLKNRKILLI